MIATQDPNSACAVTPRNVATPPTGRTWTAPIHEASGVLVERLQTVAPRTTDIHLQEILGDGIHTWKKTWGIRDGIWPMLGG